MLSFAGTMARFTGRAGDGLFTAIRDALVERRMPLSFLATDAEEVSLDPYYVRCVFVPVGRLFPYLNCRDLFSAGRWVVGGVGWVHIGMGSLATPSVSTLTVVITDLRVNTVWAIARFPSGACALDCGVRRCSRGIGLALSQYRNRSACWHPRARAYTVY